MVSNTASLHRHFSFKFVHFKPAIIAAVLYLECRYISVDTYGQCGELKCDSCCFQTLQKDYKFYLAFENSNCRDYITEKLFGNAFK